MRRRVGVSLAISLGVIAGSLTTTATGIAAQPGAEFKTLNWQIAAAGAEGESSPKRCEPSTVSYLPRTSGETCRLSLNNIRRSSWDLITAKPAWPPEWRTQPA